MKRKQEDRSSPSASTKGKEKQSNGIGGKSQKHSDSSTQQSQAKIAVGDEIPTTFVAKRKRSADDKASSPSSHAQQGKEGSQKVKEEGPSPSKRRRRTEGTRIYSRLSRFVEFFDLRKMRSRPWIWEKETWMRR